MREEPSVHCPFCRNTDSRVVDSRTADDGGQILAVGDARLIDQALVTLRRAAL